MVQARHSLERQADHDVIREARCEYINVELEVDLTVYTVECSRALVFADERKMRLPGQFVGRSVLVPASPIATDPGISLFVRRPTP